MTESLGHINPIQSTRDPAFEREKLKKACQDFEALLTAQMIESMRPKDSEEPGGLSLGGANPLQNVFDWELARVISERSPLGIAETLMRQFEQSIGGYGEALDEAELDRLVSEAANANNLDPNLIRAVIQVESAGDPGAVSVKGAKGLMQLMDETAARYGVTDSFDPRQNVAGGAAYLNKLLKQYNGDLELTLAAYNAGEQAVARYDSIPPYKETQDYVRRVLDYYREVQAVNSPQLTAENRMTQAVDYGESTAPRSTSVDRDDLTTELPVVSRRYPIGEQDE
jgi:Rod binding domain-containing protein